MFHIHTHKPSGLLTENELFLKHGGVFEACNAGSKICTLLFDNSHYNQFLPLEILPPAVTTTEPLD
jgi:hypothetical protein